MPSFPTPVLHIPWSQFPKDVYEPSEDTFLLLDALDSERDVLVRSNVNSLLEVCCGNGFPIISSSMYLKHVWSLAIDINTDALKFTKALSQSNGVHIDAIHTSLTLGLKPFSIDLILCNPPYVPSDSHIATLPIIPRDAESIIDLAWKGGSDGMEFFHSFIPEASRVLVSSGLLYCVVLMGPWERYLEKHKLYIESYFKEYSIIAKRKSVLETLIVIRFIR